MNLKQLWSDKRVRYGAIAVTAAAGAAAWWAKRKAAASSGGDAGDGAVPAAAPVGAGQLGGAFPDTTGSNVAGWFSQYSESVQRQLDEYQRTLNDTLASLHQAQQTTTPVHTRVPLPSGGYATLPANWTQMIMQKNLAHGDW